MRLNLEEVGDHIRGFLRELERERYAAFSGEKGFLNTTQVFARHQELFDVFLLADLEEECSRESGEKRRKVSLSYRHLLSQYPRARTSELTDRLFHEVVDRSGGVGDGGVPLSLVDSIIAQEPDRDRRISLYRSRGRVVEELNHLMRERLDGMHEACEEVGFPDLFALCLKAGEIEISWVTDVVNLILERTEGIYLERMDEMVAREIGPSIHHVERHDLLHLLRGARHDSLFSNRELVRSVELLIGRLGLDSIDSDISFSILHNRMPFQGAYTFPLDVPEEIRTIMRLGGGYGDYIDIFGAAGYSASLASIARGLPPEYKYLGDPSVGEGYALLFSGILGNSSWLGGMDEQVNRFLELFYVRKMYELRRHASLLRYELRIPTTPPDDAPHLFKSIMDEHLHVSHDPCDYLLNVTRPFYSVSMIRAYILEGMLRTTLEQKFGEDWFFNPLSSKFLREIWSWGGRYDLREMAHYLGFAELDPEPMLETLEDSLQSL